MFLVVDNSDFSEAPSLSRDDLVDLAGWAVLKEARGLVEIHAVREVQWEKPVLKGKIALGGTSFHPRLNLRSLTFAENQCNCPAGRKGMVCAHAIALCLAVEAIKSARPTVEETPSQIDIPDSVEVRSLTLSEKKGKPLFFRILLPPNLASAARRDAISVKVEVCVGNDPPRLADTLDRGLAYFIPPEQLNLAKGIEQLCDGRLHGFLQLSRSQLLSLLNSVVDQPCVFFIRNPAQSVPWFDGELRDIHRHLLRNPSEADQKPVRESGKFSENIHHSNRSAGRAGSRKSIGSPDSNEGPTVDGSSHFLAITLPARRSTFYQPVRELVESSGFKLEPSNRKWWLRDTHRTRQFLAENWDALENQHNSRFTDNFIRRTEHLKRAKTAVAVHPEGEQFVVDVDIRAGNAEIGMIRSAVESGSRYVESGKNVFLFNTDFLKKVHQAQKLLSGEINRPLQPHYRKRVSTASLRDVELLLEAIAPGWQPPKTWLERSAALQNLQALRPAPVSKQLDERLRLYQHIGVAWLWHLFNNRLGGILADEMGLGKTIQALALIECLLKADPAPSGNSGRNTILIVCPASLVENWRREAARFIPEIAVAIHHRENRLPDAATISRHQVVITSYATLSRDIPLFEKIPFLCIIADEAQHIRNRNTVNARSLRSLKARGRFLLSGTPLENSIDDLRALFEFLMPGYLARVPAGLRGEERAWFEQRHLAQSAPYILRRSKSLVAPELPEKIEQTVFLDFNTQQATLYRKQQETGGRALLNLTASGASRGKLRMEAFTQLLRLRQVCADPRILDNRLTPADSAKLEAFHEILDEAVDSGSRILVFSQFVSVLQGIASSLEDRATPFCYLDGKTRNRQAVCDRFNEDESIPVFLISLKAGGTGLNLTGADTVIHYDPWWNPAAEAQATDRAHRIGQSRKVTSIRLIMSGSVEERVMQLQKTKAGLLEALFEESESNAARITMEDLQALLE